MDFTLVGLLVLIAIIVRASVFYLSVSSSVFPASALALALVSISWAAVSAAADERPQNGIEYFEKHIRPMFAKHCYQCHSKRAKELEGGLLLDSRAGWMEGGESGLSVVAGDVDGSLLIQAVRYADPDLQMPPIKPLTPEEVAHLET